MHLQEVSLRSSEASMQCSIGYGVYLILSAPLFYYCCDGSDFIYW